MQKKVLVTGGAGFIGSHCVDALLARGMSVSVLDLKSREEANNLSHVMDQITYVEGDVRNGAAVLRAVSGHTHVLHLAAMVSVPASIEDPITSHEINVDGTLNVFEAARKASVEKVVYASSAAVYGDTEEVPTPEHASLEPTSPYGLHKVINEAYARLYGGLYGLPAVGLRFFNVYGSRQDPHSPYSGVISIFAECMKGGGRPTIFGDGTASRDFVHVHDVAKTCVAALFQEDVVARVYNVGTGVPVTLRELVKTLNAVLGTEVNPVYGEERPGDILHSCALTERLKELRGGDPFLDFESGLKEVLGVKK